MQAKKRTALVVDDKTEIRKVLAAQLESLGYEPQTASSGEEALERLKKGNFNLVMLDMRMPGLTGIDVLQRFPAKKPKPYIMMLTGVADAVLAAQCLALGANDYVTKPCTLGHLKERLQRAEQPAEARQEPAAAGSTDQREVTFDLIRQQLNAFERMTSGARSGRTEDS